MKENINQKIAKIPFWMLYVISAFIITFDLVFTYFFLSANSHAREGNPLNAYLASIFGLNYFLILIPIVMILLFAAAKLGDWIISTFYKQSQIKGDNHVLVAVILLTFSNILFNEVFVLLFDIKPMLSFKNVLIIGMLLMGVYITITEIADSKSK